MSLRVVWTLCLLLCGLRLLWPGDAPFIQDEPKLVSTALEQNAARAWTVHGLHGTQSVDYGPLPILFYRAVLKLTHEPLAWVLIKTLLVSAVTLVSVGWFLSLYPGIPAFTALLPFLSPYLWFYARDLWDNSLLIPLSALTFVATLAFDRRPDRARLGLSLAGACACLLVHLMALPLAFSVLAFISWRHAPWLKRNRGFLALVLCGCLGASSGYIGHLAGQIGASGAGSLAAGSRWSSALFALSGFRFFSAWGLEYFFGDGWFRPPPPALGVLIGGCAGLTALAALPALAGLRALLRMERDGRDRSLGRFVGLILVSHAVLLGALGVAGHPHYLNAAWMAFFACVALGLADLSGRSPRWKAACGVYLAALGVTLGFIAVSIHRTEGNRELHYGATLTNLRRIASGLACCPGSIVLEDRRRHAFLEGLRTLRELTPCAGEEVRVRRLVLDYAHPEDGRTGALVLRVPD